MEISKELTAIRDRLREQTEWRAPGSGKRQALVTLAHDDGVTIIRLIDNLETFLKGESETLSLP